MTGRNFKTPNGVSELIGTTTGGLFIFEIEGKLFVFSEKDVEEVFPFTVRAERVGAYGIEAFFIVPEELVGRGDLLKDLNNNVWKVLQTQKTVPAARATVFKGFRLIEEEL